MPDRIIRERMLTSETLGSVGDFAERLFWRLVVVADDFGRFAAQPAVLFGRTMPLVAGATMRRFEHALFELVAVKAIALYEVGGKKYGHFPNFAESNRSRATTSKYPSPELADVCLQPSANDYRSEPDQKTYAAPNTNSHSKTNPDPSFPEGEREGKPNLGGDLSADTSEALPSAQRAKESATRVDFPVFWEIYPRKDGKQSAREAWAKLELEEQAAAIADIPLRIEANWTGREIDKIPHAATYLNQKRWQDELQRASPPQRARPSGIQTLLEMGERLRETERNRDRNTPADQRLLVSPADRSRNDHGLGRGAGEPRTARREDSADGFPPQRAAGAADARDDSGSGAAVSGPPARGGTPLKAVARGAGADAGGDRAGPGDSEAIYRERRAFVA